MEVEVEVVKMGKVLIMLAAFVLLLAACSAPEAEQESGQQSEEVIRKVKVAEAVMQAMGVPTKTEGVLQAHARVEAAAEIGGTLIKKHVESGAWVEKGQLLYELDQADLKSGLRRAELAKERVLLEMKNAKGQLREEDTSTLDMLSISLKEAELAISDAKRNLERSVIRSPIAGVVTELAPLTIGQQIGQGQRLVQIEQVEPMFVEASITEKDMLVLEERAELAIFLPAFGQSLPAKAVSIVSATASGQQHGFRLKAELEEIPAEWTVRPGMSAHIILDDSLAKETLVVPIAAVLQEDGKPYVYRVPSGGGKVEKVTVEPGRMNQESAEVLSGLRSGDLVVVVGQSLLEDGDAVEVLE